MSTNLDDANTGIPQFSPHFNQNNNINTPNNPFQGNDNVINSINPEQNNINNNNQSNNPFNQNQGNNQFPYQGGSIPINTFDNQNQGENPTQNKNKNQNVYDDDISDPNLSDNPKLKLDSFINKNSQEGQNLNQMGEIKHKESKLDNTNDISSNMMNMMNNNNQNNINDNQINENVMNLHNKDINSENKNDNNNSQPSQQQNINSNQSNPFFNMMNNPNLNQMNNNPNLNQMNENIKNNNMINNFNNNENMNKNNQVNNDMIQQLNEMNNQMGNINNQLNEMNNQMGDMKNMKNQLTEKNNQMGNMNNQMNYNMNNQMNNNMNNQGMKNDMSPNINVMNNQMKNEIEAQANNNMSNQINDMNNQGMKNDMNPQITSDMSNQINFNMNQQMNSNMIAQMNNNMSPTNNDMNNQMNNNQNNDKINPINNSMNNPMNNNNMNAQKNSDMNNQMINNMNAQLNNDKNNQINNSMGNQMNQINNNMSNQMGNNMSNPINNSMSNPINNSMSNQMNFNQNNISIDPNNQNSNMNIINNQSMQNNNMNINQNNNNIQMSVPLENGNQHMQNIPNQKYSFSRYKIAARTGLKNLGDTSYLNSVLQLLGCIRNLASYFVKPSNQKYFVDNINTASLSFVLHRLYSHFYPYPEKNQREVYDTSTILQVLGRDNQVYNTKKRRNPNDLIIYCLDKIHKEINFAKNKIEFDTNINIFNKDDVIKKRFNEYLAFNDSIVSKNFTWFEIKQLRCKTCSTQAYNLNSFFIYNLDISGAFQQYNFPLTILKCLEYQYKKTKNNFCQSCNNYQQMDIETKIFSSPLSFVFSIDRGNCDMNLMQIPFIVEQYIDINNYLEIKEAFHKFEIQGIVSISLGENNKYVCFAKSPVDKQWYLYDDGNVMNVDINAILNVHNNNGGYIPCILLYQFIK